MALTTPSSVAWLLLLVLLTCCYGQQSSTPSPTTTIVPGPGTTPSICPQSCGWLPFNCDDGLCQGSLADLTCHGDLSRGCTCVSSGGYEGPYPVPWDQCPVVYPLWTAPSPSATAPTPSVITVTEQGYTFTASYLYSTDTALASLEDTITLTDSHVETITDGGTRSVVTATDARTVFPFGVELVAWVPPPFIPPGVPTPTFSLPRPTNTREPKQCPKDDSTPKCSDPSCVGLQIPGLPIWLCSIPPLSGCRCETNQCPDKGEIPCDDCSGQEGACTTGEWKGCDCYDDPCPDGRDTIQCDQCGGQGKTWNTCAGKTETREEGRFKDCFCSPYSYNTAGAGLTTDTQYDLNYISQHLLAWNDKYDLTEYLPVCQKSAISVPKNTTHLNVADAIESFCTTYNGSQLNMPLQSNVYKFGNDTVYDIFPLSNTTAFWLSASFRRDASAYCKSQQGTVAMAYEDCSRVLNYALNSCDTGDTVTHGSAVTGGCINYNITNDQDTRQSWFSPPWARLAPDAFEGQCDVQADSTMDTGMVQSNFFHHIYPAFCNQMSANYIRPFERVLTAADYVPFEEDGDSSNPNMYPPVNGNPWRYKFTFDPENGTAAVLCRLSCTDAFHQLSYGNCGNKGPRSNEQASWGMIWAGCGIYSYEIERPSADEYRCYWEGYRGRYAFSIDQAATAIDKFCHNLANDGKEGAYMTVAPSPDARTHADPAFPERNYYFKFPGKAYNVSVRFSDQAEAPADYDPFPAPVACNPNAPRSFRPIDYKQDCMQLVAALKSCKCCCPWLSHRGPGLLGELTRYGASVVQHQASYGCAVWTITSWVGYPRCLDDSSCHYLAAEEVPLDEYDWWKYAGDDWEGDVPSSNTVMLPDALYLKNATGEPETGLGVIYDR